MKRTVKAALSITAVTLAGTAAYAVAQSRRPVMPAFTVDLRAPASMDGRSLLLIYGENGSDPSRSGRLAPDQRVGSCKVTGARCVSEAARLEYGAIGTRAQSLQVRLLTAGGNPIVGAVRWTGPSHPRRVRIVCDLREGTPVRACVFAGSAV